MRPYGIGAACACVALSATPSLSNAQDLMGLARSVYLEARVGVPFTSGTDSTVTSSVPAANGTTETEFSSGRVFSGAVGLSVFPNVRVDAEISNLRAGDPQVEFKSGFPGNAFAGQKLDAEGHVKVWSYLLNAYYDFPEILPRLRPFVGGGVGFSDIEVDNVSPAGSRFIVRDSDTVFTGALHAGASYRLSEQFSLTARYTAGFTDGPTFDGTDTAGLGGTMRVEGDGQITHLFSIGLRFAFN